MRASESERALACPASLVLPRTDTSSPRAMAAANYGTLVHWWKESGDWCPDWADPSDISLLSRKLALTGVRREDYWSGGEHEVTFAVDFWGGLERFRGARDEADAWKAGHDPKKYLTGTIDYLAPGRLDDLKTGRWLPPISEAKQLRSYALLPWMEEGCRDDWAIQLSFTQWEKYPLAGRPRVMTAVFTGVQARRHLKELRYAVTNGEDVNPGEKQCRYCPCRDNCTEAMEIQ